MGSLKKFDGSSWINSNLRKLTTDTDTFTTFPAIIYAEGTNATVGLKGNTVQNGTPTPDNPIMPEGTGERTGNLFDYQTMAHGTDGMLIDENGNLQNNSTWAVTTFIPCNGSTFTLHKVGGETPAICLYDAEKRYIIGKRYNTGSASTKSDITIISQTNASYIRFSWYRQNGAAQDDLTTIMLNLGSTPLPYEPYGYKIPISSANTTTPVYLGEVETTRRIKKLVFDGTENWYTAVSSTGLFGIQRFEPMQAQPFIPGYSAISNCYVYNPAQSGIDAATVSGEFVLQASGAGSTLRYNFFIKDGRYDNLNSFISYLAAQYAAGTPVTVWYVLATEETAVNEPLMKIGDYADTVSGISIPVTAGGDTLSVGTTVQPSEVTANYYGWHTITVHERESGQWD